MSTDGFESQFERLQRAFESCGENRLADAAIQTWTRASDQHLPSVLMQQSLRQLLQTSYHRLASTRGVGPTKLARLLVIVERAVNALRQATPRDHPSVRRDSQNIQPLCGSAGGRSGEGAYSHSGPLGPVPLPELPSSDIEVDLESLDEDRWRALCRYIQHHRLQYYPLGRFARSLRELPRGLWNEPLSSFVDRTLAETNRFRGYGEERLRCVIEVMVELGAMLSHVPTNAHYKLQILPAAIRDLVSWIERMLDQENVPDFDEVRQYFVLPLLQQLEIDLEPKVADMVARRIGPDGVSQTLDEIASDFDLTRERIRQLTSRGSEVLAVRWPEGKLLLDNFYERFRAAPRAHEQMQLAKRVLDTLFDFSIDSSASSADVIAAWEAAGRRRQTPMTENEIRCWLSGEFPQLAPDVGLEWIIQEARVFDGENGRQIYFSNADLDQLLYELYRRGSPALLQDLLDIEGKEERNLRVRISRDLRFLEDEYKRLLPAEDCSFIRFSEIWHVDLVPAKRDTYPALTSIMVEGLAHLTISGLMEAGIADATVWGVHRYANEMLERMFGANLPAQVTPFILADMLVGQTGGLIRPMRRRRLRWDNEHSSIPVRGKRGWVGYAVSRSGVPITLDELGDLLRKYYQDYAPYVLSQMNLDNEEEGEFHCSAIFLSGIPHRIPPLLVPADWQFDLDRENVSEEIKLIIAKIIGMARDGTLQRDDLMYAPWLIELVERHTYGEEIWQQQSVRSKRSIPEEIATENTAREELQAPTQQRRNTANSTDVDDLLSKFL